MPNSDQLIILTPGFPTDEQDTTCIPWLQHFVLALRRVRPSVRVTVIAFQYPYQPREYEWHGIRVFASGGANRKKLLRLITWVRVLRTLRQLRREDNIVGVLSLWLAECAFVGGWFAKANGLRHYACLVGQDARAQNHYIRRIRPDGDRIIAFSDSLRDELARNFGVRPGIVINNGINEEGFPALNTAVRKYDLLGAGSLIPVKRYSLFIEIVQELKKTFPDIKTAIAGKGTERSQLQAQIEAGGLTGNVTLLGETAHPDTLKLMNQAKLFLHTSEYEGNSSVLMEALYAGCQVVSFRSLADRHIENMWICQDSQEMAKTAERLLSNPPPVKRVVFNLMTESAGKIADLYDIR
jgi:glycosyltransferase involved in cell wall biosynthesis